MGDLVRTVVTLCSAEEQERLREMEDWIVKNEGTWVLAEGFNSFLGNVLHKEGWPSEGRVAMLRLLGYDVCSELAMAILQFFQGKPPEEQVFRCMGALSKFCSINREVPQLVKMIGPEPSKFNGMSPRIDEILGPLNTRLASIPMF